MDVYKKGIYKDKLGLSWKDVFEEQDQKLRKEGLIKAVSEKFPNASWHSIGLSAASHFVFGSSLGFDYEKIETTFYKTSYKKIDTYIGIEETSTYSGYISSDGDVSLSKEYVEVEYDIFELYGYDTVKQKLDLYLYEPVSSGDEETIDTYIEDLLRIYPYVFLRDRGISRRRALGAAKSQIVTYVFNPIITAVIGFAIFVSLVLSGMGGATTFPIIGWIPVMALGLEVFLFALKLIIFYINKSICDSSSGVLMIIKTVTSFIALVVSILLGAAVMSPAEFNFETQPGNPYWVFLMSYLFLGVLPLFILFLIGNKGAMEFAYSDYADFKRMYETDFDDADAKIEYLKTHIKRVQ